MNTGDGIEHRARTVKHAETSLDFRSEVNVARRIDDVDCNVVPLASCGSRGDGDSTLLLLRHPVHGGGTFVHFTDFVRASRVVKDALSRSRLTSINMSHDADIPHFVQRCSASHSVNPVFLVDQLPPVMGEGLIGFSHTVNIILFLHCAATHVGSVIQLIR